ncbi:MAG TPA: penicillin-binding protein 1C [Cyclobacteriaceae bacterium]|nr:penicillin-binding protein 1C [Cyclobacteriaceae bacterium]
MTVGTKRKLYAALVLAGLVIYYFSLPGQLFIDPYSTVLEDKNGALLSAAIASDGQWRFPESEVAPEKFTAALTSFEDQRFFYHPGVDLISLGRAIGQNIHAGRVVSGGSTITMQVIRLSRKGKPRTVWEKVVEIVLATRLEFRCSKREILNLYSSHAPFGGNVVGLEAACWRYFGRDPNELSWGEACMLAVLPNAPALIHPGKNREQLKKKRDRLLDKLSARGFLDSLDCSLAKQEPIPDEPMSLPRHARHLMLRAAKDGYAQTRLRTTVDLNLQTRVEQILQDHYERLRSNQVHNAAALVLDVETGEVLAYAGNIEIQENNYHGDDVDIIVSPRSTGSILKPFLYAAMLDEGKILPATLIPDVPTIVAGFAPQNFSHEYDGAVHASEALIRSLNVPAVQLLQNYRYEKFHSLLRNLGMTTLNEPPDHYGLSLILGGAECTLWDISGMYASMARTLNHYFEHPGKNRYTRQDYFSPTYITKRPADEKILGENSWLSAASIFQTFTMLKEVYRPGEESGWRYFSSSKKIAWKTGTSFGHRDAWAVGVTPEYVVGVWAGNADGEGRPGLTGTEAAAPLLFDIFSLLPGGRWFERPTLEMEKILVCHKSGMRVGEYCEEADTAWVVRAGLQTLPCPYHKRVHLSQDLKFRVHANCASVASMRDVNWFVLPPVQEYYYRPKNISYKVLPPVRQDCQVQGNITNMDLIYPRPDSKIFIPKELDGSAGSSIFELAHRDPNSTVYWHVDGVFIGATFQKHQMAIQSGKGNHVLTLVDDTGEILERAFHVLSGM